MRLTTSAALLLTIAAAAPASAQTPAADSKAAAPPALKWGPAPDVFPPGAQLAVLQGDPGSAALFTIRLRFPNGYKIAPHTHPTDEHLTVISGTFRVGMGATFDKSATMSLKAGGFATAPANHAHFAAAEGVTVVQVTAMGPFALTYVNPADAPRVSASR